MSDACASLGRSHAPAAAPAHCPTNCLRVVALMRESLTDNAEHAHVLRWLARSHCSSFIFLQMSVVWPVLESIFVLSGKQLQVTVLAFSCEVTTQCSIVSAIGGGVWLRIAGVGCFFAAQPERAAHSAKPTIGLNIFIWNTVPAC